MKPIFFVALLISCFVSAQQNRNDSIKGIKQQLLQRIYGNQKITINYDKSFVSEDRIFYENLGGRSTHHPTNELYSFSEKELVKKTLQNYIDGSSYNNLEQIESAFTDNATLYLTINNEFKQITPKEYVSFFKNRTHGEFNGRVGKILSIDIEKDIATAKIEIKIPKKRMRYIDLLLLRKTEMGWKIISKTATKTESNKRGSRILFIVSNAHFYGDSKLKTGNSFSEIVNAYDVFIKAGFTVDFVSPTGGAIPLAYINTSVKLTKDYLYNEDLMYALKHTKSPKNINPAHYKAVQYIGGGSTMFDTPSNKELQHISMEIYEKYNGIISSVCHGTAGIVHLKTKDGKYLVDGKRVSGYPEDYESKDKPYFKTFPFLIKETIEERGGEFRFSKPNMFHVEVDGRLITGQNYLSSKPVALKIIELLTSGNK